MDFNFCAYLIVVIRWVVGQKYKVVLINGHTNLDQFDITPESNQFISEIKGCSSGYVSFRDRWNSWQYIVNFDSLLTGKMNVTLRIRDKILVSELYNHNKDCDTFIKIKIGWKDWKFTVWSYHVTGWNKIMTWDKELPVLSYISKVQVSNGQGFHWRLYVLEHSTSPNKVTCVNY